MRPPTAPQLALMEELAKRPTPVEEIYWRVGEALIRRGWMCREETVAGERCFLTVAGWEVYDRIRSGQPIRDRNRKVSVGVRLGADAMAALERGVREHCTQAAAVEVALVAAFPEPVVLPKRRRS